jgi:hypothetical protein
MMINEVDLITDKVISDADRKALRYIFGILAERGRKLRLSNDNEKDKTADDFDLGQIASSAAVNSDSIEPEL